MRGFIVFLLVVGAIFWAGKSCLSKHGSGGLSMDRLVSGSPTDARGGAGEADSGQPGKGGRRQRRPLQTAICQWDSGLIVIQDRNELEQAYDAFDGWRDEFDINHRKIAGYTITGSELVQEKPPVVMVSGTIENRTFKIGSRTSAGCPG